MTFQLPSTLTPQNLEIILRYGPVQRRKIEGDLELQCKGVWDPCGKGVSDQEFYSRLHKFLQNPQLRTKFNSIAQIRSSGKRKLALHVSIHKHYAQQYPAVRTIRSSRHNNEFVSKIVKEYAANDDIECLTNVVWAFLDDASIAIEDLDEILESYPKLTKELSSLEIEEFETIDDSDLYQNLALFSKLVGDMTEDGLNPQRTNELVRIANTVKEISRSNIDEFRKEIVSIQTKYKDILDHSRDLHSVRSALNEWKCASSLLQDWEDATDSIRQEIAKFLEEDSRVKQYAAEVADASADELEYLAGKIRKCGKHERTIADKLNEIVSQFVLKDSVEYSASTSKIAQEVDASDTADVAQNLNSLITIVDEMRAEGVDSYKVSELVCIAKKLQEIANSGLDEFIRVIDSLLTDYSEILETSTDLNVVKDSLIQWKVKETVPRNWQRQLATIQQELADFKCENSQIKQYSSQISNSNAEDVEILGQKIRDCGANIRKIVDRLNSIVNSIDDTPEEQRIDDRIETIVTPDESENRTEVPFDSESQLLSHLLINGKFSLAYWVATKSNTLPPAILGALAEGSCIQPGSTCSGQLANYFDELSLMTVHSNDEKLLLVASIIQPLLFLRDYPHALYQLVSTVPATTLTNFVVTMRGTYIPQGVKLPRNAVYPDAEELKLTDELDRVSAEAAQLSQRLSVTRINYQVADRIHRTLFSKDSPFSKILSHVRERRLGKVEEVRTMCQQLNPDQEISMIEKSIHGLKKVGRHPREKLLKNLHKCISIGQEWVFLEDRKKNSPQKMESQIDSLKKFAIEEIQTSLNSLNQNPQKSAACEAAIYRLNELMRLLNGEKLNPESIDHSCILLPDIELDDEMTPGDVSDEIFLTAVRKFMSEDAPSAEDVYEKCLKNHEFERCQKLIGFNKMGEEFANKLEKKRNSRRQHIRERLAGLQDRVEEIFLLGQTWNVQNDEANFRADLLSMIEDGKSNLEQANITFDNFRIREVGKSIKQIEGRLEEIERKMLDELSTEKDKIVDQFPDTDDGRDDKNYFESTHETCTKNGDYVTAFDLIDRAKSALSQNKRIVRTAPTQVNEDFTNFLKFAEKNTKEIRSFFTRGDQRKKVLNSIKQGKSVFDIPFGHVDKPRIKDSISLLEKLRSLDHVSGIEEVCRFLEFPIISKNIIKKEQFPKGGMVHYSVQLDPVGSMSPIPEFGSNLNSSLNIILVQVPKEPEQVSRFIRQVQIPNGKGVLVILNHVVSNHYRLKWLKENTRTKLAMLPIDRSLLLYLCGKRNRHAALLNIGLPLIWSQPYIAMGEMVPTEMFVGREKEVDDLVDQRGGCIVFGGRQLGKSALLTHVKREYHNPKNYGGQYIAYLDVNDLGQPQKQSEMTSKFWSRVSEELGAQGAIQNKLDINSKRAFADLSEQVPNLIESMLQNDDQMRIILLLDETDKLLNLDAESDFTIIRKLRSLMAKSNRRFKVILAGLQSVQRYNNWENHPFAQLGNEIVIDPLSPKAAEQLITKPFAALGFEFEKPTLVCRIVSVSNYHPGLIQIFCRRLLANLYEGYFQWDKDDFKRYIRESDVLAIEQDAQFKQDVRNRFDWTLDLDDRYKVLTYGLMLSDKPTEARNLQELKKLGETWWPKVFAELDVQGIRALLNELVGLGVLLSETDGATLAQQFRIRSPNLLRLLGTQDEIETELLQITTSDKMSMLNPNNFHSVIGDSGVFGPFTQEQEGYLLNTNTKSLTTVILGSPAMGIRDASEQIQHVLNSFSDSHGNSWKELHLPNTGGAVNSDKILTLLNKRLSPTKRENLYAIVNFEELAFDGDIGQFLEECVDLLKKKCRSKSKGRLYVILGPHWSLKWNLCDLRSRLENRADFTVISLNRWSDGAVSNALDRIKRQTHSKASGKEINKITSGVHSLINETLNLARNKRGTSANTVVKIAQKVKGNKIETESDKFLSELGIKTSDLDLTQLFEEVFLTCNKKGDEHEISKSETDRILEKYSKEISSSQYFEQVRLSLRDWLESFEFISVLHENDAGHDYHKVCSLTVQLYESITN